MVSRLTSLRFLGKPEIFKWRNAEVSFKEEKARLRIEYLGDSSGLSRRQRQLQGIVALSIPGRGKYYPFRDEEHEPLRAENFSEYFSIDSSGVISHRYSS